jgi:hypothetical protein
MKHAMSFSNFETCVGDETNDTKLTTKPHLIPPTLPQRCGSLLNVKTQVQVIEYIVVWRVSYACLAKNMYISNIILCSSDV